MGEKNESSGLEKVMAIVTVKSIIGRKERFEEHYDGDLYIYGGVDFGINFDVSLRARKNYPILAGAADILVAANIKRLIIGINHRCYGAKEETDEKEYNKLSQKLNELTAQILVGNIIEITYSIVGLCDNRIDPTSRSGENIKCRRDPLWRNDCLFYAPFGYEPMDRLPVISDVKDVKVIEGTEILSVSSSFCERR